MSLLVLGALAMIGLLLVGRSVRRFAEQQRRLGRWDANGPLVETAPPPHAKYGGGMSERLEVIGEWHGEVLRDRRKQSADSATGEPDAPSAIEGPSRQSTGERSTRLPNER